jgi:hypothetical protein
VNRGGHHRLSSASMSQANPLEYELRRANEILKAASVFFATELDADRPK